MRMLEPKFHEICTVSSVFRSLNLSTTLSRLLVVCLLVIYVAMKFYQHFNLAGLSKSDCYCAIYMPCLERWNTKGTKEILESLTSFCLLFVCSGDSKRKESRTGNGSKDRESSKERDKEKNKERDGSRDREKEDDKDKRKQVLLICITPIKDQLLSQGCQ